MQMMPRLGVLRLAAVEMGSRGVAAISDAFLSIAEDNAPVVAGKEDSTEIGAAIVPLVQLDLENNEIGDNGTEDLAEALRVMPNLQVLKFAGNRPAFEGTQAIMNSVGSLSALQVSNTSPFSVV
jgi:Ran GTPase-activating protein (RanGAP) involved in mRNA processing and transport